jgi:hypothetical protein
MLTMVALFAPFSFRSISLLGSELRPGSQVRTPVPEDEDTDDATDSQAAEQANTRADAEIMEQRCREVDCAGGDGGAGKVVAREQRGRILWVCQVDVQEDTLEEDENADGEDHDAKLFETKC